MKVILPKHLVPDVGLTYPLFFLAGPVGGGDDWHLEATNFLQKKVNEFFVAIPQKYTGDHPLFINRVGCENIELFPHQFMWKNYYFQLAAGIGNASTQPPAYSCLVIWLPAESETALRPDAPPYVTYPWREVGTAIGWLKFNKKLRIVFGADPSFPGLGSIRRSFEAVMDDEFPIWESLETTMKAAVHMALP